MRLDVYLADSGTVKSRSRAAQLISGGFVSVNGKIVTKASHSVNETDEIVLLGNEHQYVGRGGMKLEGALDRFQVQVNDLFCADIGASTGGFTDCLLQRGAAHVYAIDSGHDQLDSALASDPRVTNLEGCNARYLTVDLIGRLCQCAVSDLSFISQTLVIPAVTGILDETDIEAFEKGIVLGDGTECMPAKLEIERPSVGLATVYEGKYHQVKRMFASRGKHVTALQRLSIGSLKLDSSLAAGEFREISEEEKKSIFE